MRATQTFDYDNAQNTYQSGTSRRMTVKNITAGYRGDRLMFGKEADVIVLLRDTHMRILRRSKTASSLNSGSLCIRCSTAAMLEFLGGAACSVTRLTAWTVNGNAITSGIEQKPEEKQLMLRLTRSDYCRCRLFVVTASRRSRSTTSPCPLIRSVTRVTAVRFPQKSPARACAHTSRRTSKQARTASTATRISKSRRYRTQATAYRTGPSTARPRRIPQ